MTVETLFAKLTTDKCEAAKAMWALKFREAKRYANLAYLVAAAAAITLAVAIVALLWAKEYGLGIASAVGTVVEGAGWMVVRSMRNDALKDAADWIAKVHEYCGDDAVAQLQAAES